MQIPAQHWKERAIQKSEAITDAWEVSKTWLARAAEWVLFGCMVMNIIEILPGVAFWTWLADSILGIQAITLDIAGFGLASMADHAKASGNEKAAKSAKITGWFLIGLMLVTITNVTCGLLFPGIGTYTQYIDKGLILARVGMMVVYGHVVHGLRSGKTAQSMHALQEENNRLTSAIDTLQQHVAYERKQTADTQIHLEEKQQELSRAQMLLTNEKKHAASLQADLESGNGDVSAMRRDLQTAQVEADTLRAQMEGKQRELDILKQSQSGTQEATTTLRKELNSANLQIIDLTGKLDGANLHMVKLEKAEKQVEELAMKLQKKEQDCESVKAQLVKVRQSESVKSDVKASTQSVKAGVKDAVKAEDLSQGNITSIDQARVKVKTSDSEIIAYMKEHPDMKVPEVADHFEVTTRTIYNVLKRQESCENEAVGES